jgi:hypothetical protein
MGVGKAIFWAKETSWMGGGNYTFTDKGWCLYEFDLPCEKRFVGQDRVLELLVFAYEKGFWNLAPVGIPSGMTDVGEYNIAIEGTIIGETYHHVHRERGDESAENLALSQIWAAMYRLAQVR